MPCAGSVASTGWVCRKAADDNGVYPGIVNNIRHVENSYTIALFDICNATNPTAYTKNGKVYTYGDENWKDLLTSYNGQSITYDLQGNPLTYLGSQMEWEKGRQLKKLTKADGTIISYAYNDNGIRTGKTVGTVEHKYVLDGTKILWEMRDGKRFLPYYDNEDSVCGFSYGGKTYFFVKNQQGDIIAITNKDGGVVARYRYDAWGKVVSVTDKDGNPISSSNNIANINPFRYRGYYYDTETGLYYLQSRYYDPVVGRFINADIPELLGLTILPNGILCANLFAYCLNDPISNSDAVGFISTQQIANLLSVAAIFSMFLKYWISNVGKGLALTGGQVAVRATPIVTKFFIFKPWLIPVIVAAVVVIFVAMIALYVNRWIDTKIHNIVVKVSNKYRKVKGNSGKSNPNDLNKGMMKNQAEKFQRLIEEYKKYEGKPPNFNLPWEILVALANEAKEQFK